MGRRKVDIPAKECVYIFYNVCLAAPHLLIPIKNTILVFYSPDITKRSAYEKDRDRTTLPYLKPLDTEASKKHKESVVLRFNTIPYESGSADVKSSNSVDASPLDVLLATAEVTTPDKLAAIHRNITLGVYPSNAIDMDVAEGVTEKVTLCLVESTEWTCVHAYKYEVYSDGELLLWASDVANNHTRHP